MAGGKLYHRFAADFIHSHRHISCNRAVCKNCHEMNIHIIEALFDDYPNIVNHYFSAESFSFRECAELKRLYDTDEFAQSITVNTPGKNQSPLSFGCNLTHKQLCALATCANTYELFNLPEVTELDMANLFACKPDFHIRVNNLRRIAVLFDALLENNMVRWDWQKILGRSNILMARSGNGRVSASSLSSALSATRESPTSANEGIRRAVALLSRQHP